MEPIKDLSALFLLALSWGIYLFHPIANPQLTGGGFSKVIFAIVGSGTVLFWALSSWQAPTWAFSLIGLLLLSYILQKDNRNLIQWFLYFWINSLFALKIFLLYRNDVLGATHFLSSMALIGVVSFAMVLGHWYLVTPKLSERPLVICMNILWPIIACKVLLLSWNLPHESALLAEGTSLGGGYIFNWIMFLMRVGWGLVAIVILGYFAYRLIRMRSIQSATGVLYVMVFFVLIGELISLYLLQQYGMHL